MRPLTVMVVINRRPSLVLQFLQRCRIVNRGHVHIRPIHVLGHKHLVILATHNFLGDLCLCPGRAGVQDKASFRLDNAHVNGCPFPLRKGQIRSDNECHHRQHDQRNHKHRPMGCFCSYPGSHTFRSMLVATRLDECVSAIIFLGNIL